MISLRRRRRRADPDELDGWTDRVRDNAGQAVLIVAVIDGLRLLVRWPFLLLLGAAAGLALMFLPGSGEDVGDLVTGPGAAPFATGLRWSGLGALLGMSVLGWMHLEGGASYRRGRRVPDPRGRRRPRTGTLLIVALSATALLIAVVRAA